MLTITIQAIMLRLLMAKPGQAGDGGNMAREMAAAPLKPHDEPAVREEPAEPMHTSDGSNVPPSKERNRFDALFTSVVFTPSESDTVYTRQSSGLKSRKLANVLVELSHAGAYIRGAVYARLPKGKAKPYAELTFMGNQQSICIVTQDENAKSELIDWRNRAADAYATWRAQQNIAPTAGGRTTGPELDGVSFPTE